MKISHKQLESCRLSPKNWVAARQAGGGWAPMGYARALNLAIGTFHATEEIGKAVAKIDGYAKKFKNEKRIALLYKYLDEYAKWFESSGIISADANVLLAYPIDANWQLGGYISRVDYLSTGYYRAVLFEGIASGWKDQLRMPLIQTAIAERYGRPAAEIRVGFQDVDGNQLVDTRYGTATRLAAEKEFKAIGSQVTKLWPNGTP